MSPELDAPRVRITEIFRSIQGEGRYVGWPTVFVRLTGCPLRCQYCDTAYAFHGGRSQSINDVMQVLDELPATAHVCVTGGEPLAQPGVLPLMTRLCDQGHAVSLETSGAMDISRVDQRVSRVLDLKTPGSGEVDKNLWSNIELLTPHDQLKFVICSRPDYDWALARIEEYELGDRCEILISPSHQQVAADELAGWMLDSGGEFRFQLQLHKVLWGDEPGR